MLSIIKRHFGTARYASLKSNILSQISDIKAAGTYKSERVIYSPQDMKIISSGNKEVINFCANNYLGLANNKQSIEAAKQMLDVRGCGMASVRFICGTQVLFLIIVYTYKDIHKELEKKLADFYKTEDSILYSSCFDANGGFFECLTTEKDAVISDSLNHASIIDGIRLCKAKRFRYEHLDMKDLEQKLQETQNMNQRFIVTDGVFSMDGDIAPLDKIVDLANKYKALIFIDEAHSAGFIGPTGAGTPELFGVQKEIDIVNGTFGKALGGASGGYTTGRKEIIELLRQKSRPYLFSNSLAPPIVGSVLKILEILKEQPQFREQINKNTKNFRTEMKKAGFKILGHDKCPIAPVYIGDAKLTGKMADMLLAEGIYVIGFSFPVVPKGKARIRVQLSASHTDKEIEQAVKAFIKIGKKLSII